MAAPPLVLIDTCVWAPFFSRKASHLKSAVEQLVEEDRAALIDPVLAEILLGFKKDKEAEWVASALEGIHSLRLSRAEWLEASRLGRQLAANGHRLPLTDLVLATVSIRASIPLFTIDPHFDVIPDVPRHSLDSAKE